MKPAQWVVALVVLVTAVFVITFAMNYVNVPGEGQGEATSDQEGQGETLRLSFLSTKVPEPGMGALDQEMHASGSHDFWFVNENDRPLKVGAISKSCRCSNVYVSLIPAGVLEEKASQLSLKRGSEIAWMAEGVLESLVSLAALEKETPASSLESQAQTIEISDETSATVPPGGVGWVRMTWKGEKAGQQLLSALLWMGSTTNTQSLEARVRHHEPLKVRAADRQKTIGDGLYLEQLPYSTSLVCWSATRPALELQVSSVGAASGESPFVVGSPEPLTPEECQELEKSLWGSPDHSKVACAYRIPITLRASASAGKSLLDLGLVRRWLELKAKDTTADPIPISLEAQILGDVHVGTSGEGGRLVLSPFQRSQGSVAKRITLWTDNPRVELEVDGERTAGFLHAELVGKPAPGEQGRRVWQLEVSVPPNQASGRFPRPEDPRYQDSAVYLRIQGGRSASIRVPVFGIANIS